MIEFKLIPNPDLAGFTDGEIEEAYTNPWSETAKAIVRTELLARRLALPARSETDRRGS